MKKLLFAILFAIFSLTAITSNIQAQPDILIAGNLFSTTRVYPAAGVDPMGTGKIIARKDVNGRALANFEKKYTIANENWEESNEGGSVATFQNNGTCYAIYYNKEGQWTASVKTYPESLLAKNIRKIVKKRYFGYQIEGVHEIKYKGVPANPTYMVILQKGNSIKWIRVSDGTMDEYNFR